MSSNEPKANRLIHETSPYLLQHAQNPVDWYPWGNEAINRAREEGRLILLSVGYSACHWCHVMEHESFEDEKVAKFMNKNFVCIKVDREERPDLDIIYQTAHQIFNQRAGGWPLTAFLTPDEHAPVFVGTYFPPTARYGMPSFMDLLKNIAEQYQERKNVIGEHNDRMKEALNRLRLVDGDFDLPVDHSMLVTAVRDLFAQYDPVFGGFGEAPKFPHTTQLQILLMYWQTSTRDSRFLDRALDVTAHTLEAMAQGGLYDHLGGGFYRYSIDAQWEIPHFEKMLYDNALLMPLYVDAGICAGRDDFHKTVIHTGLWAIREMQSETGGFYSSLDADTKGMEGQFYVWKTEQIKDILAYEEFKAVDVRFGLRGEPNFEDRWHLSISNSLDVIADRADIAPSEVPLLLDAAIAKLFAARSERTPPGLDDKILASWNGLMIKAMANAGRMIDRPDFIESAHKAAGFVRRCMWKDGRLLATAKDDQARLNAYLDDYVFLADGILELLQARWNTEEFEFAVELIEVVLKHFVDNEYGAFCFTSDDHERLISRTIPTNDDSTPSSNGVAALTLIRLGHITGEQRYIEAADRALRAVQPSALHMPSAFGATLIAIEELVNPSTFIVIRGAQDEISQWARTCAKVGTVNLTVFAIPDDAGELPGLLAEKKPADNSSAIAYVCSGFRCLAPIDSLDALIESIPRREPRQ
ncbi:MAG: thioredoxin domain-containing protein [Acidiferrobacterales bacterium]|nr:thioredoxin domain-containing protein [Acidiferrobacterales bacterium]